MWIGSSQGFYLVAKEGILLVGLGPTARQSWCSRCVYRKWECSFWLTIWEGLL
jgi:hypothetical protein